MLNRRAVFGEVGPFFRFLEALLLFALCSKTLFRSEVETFFRNTFRVVLEAVLEQVKSCFRLPETLLLLELCSKRLFWSEAKTFFRVQKHFYF